MNKTNNKKLFKAIENDDLETIESVLRCNVGEVDVYGLSNPNCLNKTPLMYSLQCHNFELAKYFISKGANVRAKMSGGPESSVINLATYFGHGLAPNFEEWVAIVSELISKGADPTDGLWPALASYKNGKPQMILLLIDSGADMDANVPAGKIRELVELNKHLYSDDILSLFGIFNEE